MRVNICAKSERFFLCDFLPPKFLVFVWLWQKFLALRQGCEFVTAIKHQFNHLRSDVLAPCVWKPRKCHKIVGDFMLIRIFIFNYLIATGGSLTLLGKLSDSSANNFARSFALGRYRLIMLIVIVAGRHCETIS